MVEVRNVYKSFDGKQILKDISTDFHKGKINLIIGTSGSGKTVLLKCLLGLFPVDSGHVYFEEGDMTSFDDTQKKELRMRMGMLFQGSALFDSRTVEENIMFPLDMFTDQSDTEKLDRVNDVLHRVNLKDVNQKYPSEISGGMMKRVALARAIVLRPKYLFCDEPNSGLDPQTSIVIDQLIKDITLEYGMTTIINTHDMNTVLGIGDHIVYLKDGVKGWEGNKEEILNTDVPGLQDFIFASDFLRTAREAYQIQHRNDP